MFLDIVKLSACETFGCASPLLPDCFDTGSGEVRESFGSYSANQAVCSGVTRSAPEQKRCFPEGFPKRTLSAPEMHPNNSQYGAECLAKQSGRCSEAVCNMCAFCLVGLVRISLYIFGCI